MNTSICFQFSQKPFLAYLICYNSTWHPKFVRNELLIKVLPVQYTPYPLRVCNGAVDVVTGSSVVNKHGRHQYLGDRACPKTYTSRLLTGSLSFTVNHLHCGKTTSVVHFTRNRRRFPFPFWYFLNHSSLQRSKQAKERDQHASGQLYYSYSEGRKRHPEKR